MGVKTDYRGIVILELFPHCNFNCSFCYQNAEDRTSYFNENEKLFSKSRLYYMNLFLEKYKQYGLKDIDFCDLWGGELFFDNTLEYNEKLMEIIRTINPQKKFGVTTNLSNINSTLHSLLFDEQPFKVEIGASYDAVGRFHTKEMLDNYLNNLEIIKQSPNLAQDMIMVETVMTPEMLDDKYDFAVFDKLYADPKIDNCLLIDFRGYPDYILENFSERVLKLLKRYPKLDNAQNFLAFTGVLDDDEKTPFTNDLDRFCYCLHPNTHYFSYVTKFDMTNNHCSSCKADDYKRVEEAWGCKNCKYNNICADICPGSVINSRMIELKKCPYADIYDNIKELRKEYIKTFNENDLKKMFNKRFSI